MGKDMSGRSRFNGDHTELVRVLKPFVAQSPVWLEYPDDAKQVQPLKLGKSPRGMWSAVADLQGNFAFKITTIRKAMPSLWDESYAAWQMRPQEDKRTSWCDSMSNRFHTACLHLAKAKRNGTPKWYTALLNGDVSKSDDGDTRSDGNTTDNTMGDSLSVDVSEHEGGSSPGSVAAEEAEEAGATAEVLKRPAACTEDVKPVADSFVYGFCADSNRAWRAPANKPRKKEWATNLDKATPEALDVDFPMATFADGTTKQITDLTVKVLSEIRAVTAAIKHKGRLGALWYGEKPGKGGQADTLQLKVLKVKSKTGPLLQLLRKTETGGHKQLVQATLKRFVGNEAQQQEAALKVLVDAAEEFISGKLAEDELAAFRDKEIKKLNVAKAGDKAPATASKKFDINAFPELKQASKREAPRADVAAAPTTPPRKAPRASSPTPSTWDINQGLVLDIEQQGKPPLLSAKALALLSEGWCDSDDE